MKLVVNTKVNKAGGCPGCRAVAFNSITITAIRHSQLFLPVSCHSALPGVAAEFSCRGLYEVLDMGKKCHVEQSWRNLHLQHRLHTGGKKRHLLQNTGVWLIFSWIIKSQEVCCKGTAEFSGFDSEALSCEQAFHPSRSNRHTGCLAMVQCFNTKGFSFLFPKANLLCS